MKKIFILIVVVAIIVVAFKSGHKQEEQARLTLVEDGVEVYACGTYPVYVKATVWVEVLDKDALYPDPFEAHESCRLEPGEKEILTYSSVTKITDLLDYSVTLERKTYNVTIPAIVIWVVILIGLIIYASAVDEYGCEEEIITPIVARVGIFISGFFTLAILGVIRIIAGLLAIGPIVFSIFDTNIF